jgi:phage regulator Rha-like protein
VKRKTATLSVDDVESFIQTIRTQKVILDSDLARIYGVPTFRFNEAVKRHADRFPSDFRFQLSENEWRAARRLRSQIAILKTGRGQHRKYLPFAFTEHGAIMAANVLNSPRAVQMSIFVVRAFLKMRAALTDTRDLAQRLLQLETELKSRLDIHEAAIVDVLQRIMRLLEPSAEPAEPPRKEMGFHIKEDSVPYRVKRKTLARPHHNNCTL